MITLASSVEALGAPAQGRSISPVSVRAILRETTLNDHDLIDQAMSKLDLTDRVDYGTFLAVHHEALMTLAEHWSARDQSDFLGLLACLADDLRALNLPCDRSNATHSAGAECLDQWGLAYVIRGSRLGGAILRRRVPAGYPTSFLDYEPALTWPRFLQQLDCTVQAMSAQVHAQIVGGAKQAFAAFFAAAANSGLTHE